MTGLVTWETPGERYRGRWWWHHVYDEGTKDDEPVVAYVHFQTSVLGDVSDPAVVRRLLRGGAGILLVEFKEAGQTFALLPPETWGENATDFIAELAGSLWAVGECGRIMGAP